MPFSNGFCSHPAATLHAGRIIIIQTASQVAEALRPLAGNLAYLLFAAGIIGKGLLAVSVLASSSAYAVAEMVGLKEGGRQKARPSYGFLRGDCHIHAGRHVPRLARDQSDYSPLLYNRVERPGCATADGADQNDPNRTDFMGWFVNSGTSNILGWMNALIVALAGVALIINLATGQ
jgi:hypothetical protein